jgi:hypothetical protein
MINDSNDNRRYTISLIMVAVCLIYIIRLFFYSDRRQELFGAVTK